MVPSHPSEFRNFSKCPRRSGHDAPRVEWLREQARISGDPLEQAIADEYGNARQQVVFRIRLADVVALSGDPAQAAESLAELLTRCERDPSLTSLIDFVHQHLGKALLEAEEIEAGIKHLEWAHDLRVEKGNDELLASTRQALEVARNMLNQDLDK